MRRLKRELIVAAVLLAGVFTAFAIQAIRWRALPPALSAPPDWSADIGLVLSGDNKNRRTLAAARAFASGRVKALLITGAGYAGDSSEFLAVIAEQAGVPHDRIILERSATNTWENMTRSRPLLEENGARRVLVFTSIGHAHRAAIDAEAALGGFEVRVEAVKSDPRDESLWFAIGELAKALRDALEGRVPWRAIMER